MPIFKLDRLEGQMFGRLKVISLAGKSKNGHSRWNCICDCGKSTVVFGSNLKRFHTMSCGCLNSESITTHNLSNSKTYRCWHSMKQRCLNPKCKAYKYYGGRGINVCEDWLIFENFLIDMGELPEIDSTIERINVNGDYEKSNCKWVPKNKQNLNTRQNVFINTVLGRITIAEASKMSGIKFATIRRRMKSGWEEDRLLIPVKR